MRLQFELTDVQNYGFNTLKKQLGMATKKEVFNTALVLLGWVINQLKEGRKIYSIDEKEQHVKELAMPALENLKGG